MMYLFYKIIAAILFYILMAYNLEEICSDARSERK